MISELFGENNSTLEFNRGLNETFADTTGISWVNNNEDILIYRGINISELATNSTFEETAYLLMWGKLPTEVQLNAFSWRLRQMRSTPEMVLRIIDELPSNLNPLLALQTAMAALGSIDSSHRFSEHTNLLETAIRIIAQTPVVLASIYRHILGLPFIYSRSDLNQVENFLYILKGKLPSKMEVKSFEKTLIVQMDNGFTPSTFTARIVASTLTDFYSATSAAIGALSGSLIGGTCLEVLEVLREAKEVPNLKLFIESKVASGKDFPGIGHRFFTAYDPRAGILEDILEKLSDENNPHSDIHILRKIEVEVSRCLSILHKPNFTNADYWSGSIYSKLDISHFLFPSIAAVAKVVGWTSHLLELRQDNCLYRPKALYTGPTNLNYVPVNQR